MVDIELRAHVTKALYQNIVPYLITELALTKGDEIPLGIWAIKEMFEDSP